MAQIPSLPFSITRRACHPERSAPQARAARDLLWDPLGLGRRSPTRFSLAARRLRNVSSVTTSSRADGRAIRIASPGHAAFAVAMIWLGAMGLSKGTFVQVWQPVPGWVPAREPMAYL